MCKVQHRCDLTARFLLPQCDILLNAMTNVPPIVVIEFDREELANASIANMLAVLVDVLQHRLRSSRRSIVLLSLPATCLFSFISQTGARDVRIVGQDFFEQSYIAQSGWNFVSLGDGAKLCAEAMQASSELDHKLKQREWSDSGSACGGLCDILGYNDVVWLTWRVR
jgi:hypothetical protein